MSVSRNMKVMDQIQTITGQETCCCSHHGVLLGQPPHRGTAGLGHGLLQPRHRGLQRPHVRLEDHGAGLALLLPVLQCQPYWIGVNNVFR